jgi:hypothetical protein
MITIIRGRTAFDFQGQGSKVKVIASRNRKNLEGGIEIEP